MISSDDIVDIVTESLCENKAEKTDFREDLRQLQPLMGKCGLIVRGDYNLPYTSLPARKIFLSEYEIKQRIARSKGILKIAQRTILSPLAVEWLKEKKIKVIREG